MATSEKLQGLQEVVLLNHYYMTSRIFKFWVLLKKNVKAKMYISMMDRYKVEFLETIESRYPFNYDICGHTIFHPKFQNRTITWKSSSTIIKEDSMV